MIRTHLYLKDYSEGVMIMTCSLYSYGLSTGSVLEVKEFQFPLLLRIGTLEVLVVGRGVFVSSGPA